MQNAPLPFESLQCHTNYSDGDLTHEQVLDQCLKHKIGIVAYTDHDAIMNKAKFDALVKLNHSVKFISGTELTVNAIDGINCKVDSLHLVGLFVDFANKDLIDYCLVKKDVRVIRIKKKIEGLKKFGFDINFSDVEKLVTNGLFTSTFLGNAVIAKEANRKLLSETLEKLRIESENNAKAKEKYDLIDPNNSYKLLFELYLGGDPFVPGIEDATDFVLTLTKGVSLIRSAGGLAVLAHWSDYRKEMGVDVLERLCAEKRVDGLETVFGYGKNEKEWPEYVEGIKVAKSLNKKYNLISAGGGDFHTGFDFDNFDNQINTDLNNDTIGMTQRILDLRPDIKTVWSTLK